MNIITSGYKVDTSVACAIIVFYCWF